MKQFPQSPAGVRKQKPTYDQIATAAFHLYVENGARDGHDLDDWLRAEQLLTEKLQEIVQTRIVEAKPAPTVGASRIQAGARELQLPHNEHAPIGHEKIRQKMPQRRLAARAPQWRAAHAAHAAPAKSLA